MWSDAKYRTGRLGLGLGVGLGLELELVAQDRPRSGALFRQTHSIQSIAFHLFVHSKAGHTSQYNM